MSKPLLLVEFKGDFQCLGDFNLGSANVIAMQPCAQAFLKEKNIPYHNTLQYFGEEGHRSTLRRSKEIVDLLRESFCLKDVFGVQHAYERTFIFYLRLYLLYWMVHLHIINEAKTIHNPKKFLTAPPTPLESIAESIDKDRLLAHIVGAYAQANNVDHEIIGARKTSQNDQKLQLPGWAKELIFELLLFVYKFKSRKKNLFLVPTDSYNVPRFLNELSAMDPKSMNVYLATRRSSLKIRFRELCEGRSWFFPFLSDRPCGNNNFKESLNSQIHKLKEIMDNNPSCFQYAKVDLRKPLFAYMENGLTSELIRLNSWMRSLIKVLDAHSPKAVFSPHSLGSAYGLGEVCDKRKIPAMLISHGTHVPQENECAKIEWDEQARTMMNTHFPFVAAQTPWAERFLDEVEKLHSIPIATGPLILSKGEGENTKYEKLRQDLFPDHKDKTIVMHAGTPKCFQALRLWVYETVDEYISNINDLIRAVEPLEGMHLAIRFRPSSMLTSNDFRRLLVESSCYGIYEGRAFEDYLLASDLLVSYSSTTIEEALQNKVPVLQYDPDGKYCHIPADKIRPGEGNQVLPIYYASNKEELVLSLKWARKNHLEMKAPEKSMWNRHSYCEKDKGSWLADLGVNS